MEILDEGLFQAILNDSECKATFQKYKGELLFRVWGFAVFQILLSAFVGYQFYTMNEDVESTYAIPLFLFIAGCYWILCIRFILHGLEDLNLKKLEIKSDVFIKSTSKQTLDGVIYLGVFQDQGEVSIPAYSITKFSKNTKVYILRAAYTKTLVDIIPIDRFEKIVFGKSNLLNK